MKSNKLRLAALAMTLAMVTTSVPSSVLAADFTSDFEFTSDSEGATVDFVDPFADFVDQTEETYTGEVAAEETGITLAAEDVHFFFMEEGHEDYTVQYTPKDENGNPIEGAPFILKSGDAVVKADKVNEVNATCEAGPSFQLSAQIDPYGKYTSNIFYEGGDKEKGKLGHVWGELERRNTATCTEDGEIFDDQRCVREVDGTTVHVDETGKPVPVWRSDYAATHADDDFAPVKQNVPARGHNVKSWTTTYENLVNAVLKDGVPVQDKAGKAWSYTEVKTGICAVCNEEVKEIKNVSYKDDPISDGLSIANRDNVPDYVTYEDYEEDLEKKDYSNIPLIDCFKDGSFDVVLTQNGESAVLYTVEIKAPHHVPAVIGISADNGNGLEEFTYLPADPDIDLAATDYPEATPYNLAISRKDGVLSINSTFCAESGKNVNYVKKVYCVNADDKGNLHLISTSNEVAVAAGKHSYDTVTEEAVKNLKKNAKIKYSDVANLIPDSDPTQGPIKDAGDNLIVDLRLGTASCTSAGTVLVDFRCADCNKVVKTETVELSEKIGHVKADKAVVENYVEPTCTKDGSYNQVYYCKLCGKVAETKRVVINKLGHDWADPDDKYFLGHEGKGIVIGSANGADDAYEADDEGNEFGDYRKEKLVVRNVCERCGETEVVEDAEVEGVVVSVVPGGKYCEEKQLTVKGTYTKEDGTKLEGEFTFPYYVDVAEWSGRTPHEVGETVEENIVEPAEGKEGSKDIVTYCTLCGREITRKTLVIPAKDHVHKMTKVEAKEETCEEDGNIEYYVCKCDGENDFYYADEAGENQITLEDTVVPAAHDLKLVEAKEPTTTEEGNIEYFVCERCGKLFVQVEDPETGLGLVETTEEEVKLPKKKELPAKVEGVKTNMYPSDVYPTKGYAKISWKAVDNADNYRVSVRELGTTTWTKIETNSTATSYTVKEPLITVGKSYEVRVAAGKDGVFGPRSTVIRRYYESVKPSFAKTSNSITVSWSPVPKGSSYMVIYSENKSMKPYKTIIVRNGITEATLKSLKAGTRYYIRVRPYDKTGKTATGALSPLKSVVTKK